ncbi:Na+/H+ antiporter family protein, partial [gut metagenome]
MGGIGWGAGDFSQIPMTIVFLFTSVAALFTLRGYSVEERLAIFSRGAGSKELLLMVWIFVLAGAFAKSAQAMGSVS